MTTGITIALAIYVFLMLLAVYISRKRSKEKPTFSAFVLMNRKVGVFLLSLSLLGSYIGGGTLVALAGQISEMGLAFAFAPMGIGLAFILFGFFSSKYREGRTTTVSQEQPVSTLVEKFANEFEAGQNSSGVRIEVITIILLFIILLSFIAVQLYAGSLLLTAIWDVPKLLASAILLIVVCLYSYWSGSRGDVYSDLFQTLTILIVFIVAFISFIIDPSIGTPPNPGNWNMSAISSSGIGWILALVILPFFSIHTDASLQQRLYMAKSNQVARNAGILAGIIYFIFGIILFGVIYHAVTFVPSGDPDSILIEYALSHDNIAISYGLALAIFAAVLSTMDTMALKLSSIISHDVYKRHYWTKENPHSADEAMYQPTRRFVVLIFILAFSFSLFFYLSETIFTFLSGIWLISIGSFGLPILAFKWRWLHAKLINWVGVLKWTMVISAILVITANVVLPLMGVDDPVKMIIPGGVALVIFNFLLFTVFLPLGFRVSRFFNKKQ